MLRWVVVGGFVYRVTWEFVLACFEHIGGVFHVVAQCVRILVDHVVFHEVLASIALGFKSPWV